jgi:hypothetical protein
VIEGLFLLILFVVTLEITARVEEWVRFRTPWFSPFLEPEELKLHDEHGMHGRPGARFQKWVMNELGMRGPEVPFRKRPETIRIVAAGASETFGLHESPSREFPRQLEDSLQALLANGQCRSTVPRRFEVLNAALPGMSLPTVEQDLRLRVRDLSPDIVVFYPTPTQYLAPKAPVAVPPDSTGQANASPALSRVLYPRVIRRIRNQTTRALPASVKTWLRNRRTNAWVASQPPDWRFTALPVDRVKRFDGDLRTLIGTVRSIGATPVVATHANAFMRPGFQHPDWLSSWAILYPKAPPPMILAFDSTARPVTLKVAADSAVTVVDLAELLSRTPGEVFSDYSHLSDFGAAHAAAALAPAVLSAARARGLCE